jgi:hypothetical protein
MIKKITGHILLLTFLSFNTVFAQKQVFNYPFKFANKAFRSIANAVNLLADDSVDHLAMIIHDKKKADYIELDKNLKIVSSFSLPVKEVSFHKYDYVGGKYRQEHVGSFAQRSSGTFNFVYSLTINGDPAKQTYISETVDFNNKTVTEKEIIERNEKELTLQTFTDDGHFYCIRANDKDEELVFYIFDREGNLTKKNIPFKVPAGKKKNRNSISEYLGNAALIKNNDEPDLEAGTASAKIFYNSNGIVFVINDGASPTHLMRFDTKSMVLKENFIDHNNEFSGTDKNKPEVNSYLSDDKIFSVIVNKNNLVVAEYSLDGILVKKQEINEGNMNTVLASPIESVVRKGTKVNEDQVDDFSKLLKDFSKKTPGITVSSSNDSSYVITVGTYEPIVTVSSGSSASTHFENHIGGGGSSLSAGNGSYFNTYYTPGVSSYSKSTNYFKKTSFKIMTDDNSFTTKKSKNTQTLRDQIQEYIDGKSIFMRKQFAIGEKQYLGYNDSKADEYVIESIPIKK